MSAGGGIGAWGRRCYRSGGRRACARSCAFRCDGGTIGCLASALSRMCAVVQLSQGQCARNPLILKATSHNTHYVKSRLAYGLACYGLLAGPLLRCWDGRGRLRAMTNDIDIATPSPPSSESLQAGGGNPQAGSLCVLGDQTSPASTFSGEVSLPTEIASAPPLPIPSTEDAESSPMYRWTGRPTQEMVDRLAEVVRCPDFDEDVATAVLVGLGEGLSLTRACFVAGVKRGVVRSWCRLMPEFGKMVDVLETDLGGFWRDKAGDEAENGDPALVSARLKIAAAYDKRMRTGADDGGGQAVVNVQVNW